jgi:hypothetical protein
MRHKGVGDWEHDQPGAGPARKRRRVASSDLPAITGRFAEVRATLRTGAGKPIRKSRHRKPIRRSKNLRIACIGHRPFPVTGLDTRSTKVFPPP